MEKCSRSERSVSNGAPAELPDGWLLLAGEFLPGVADAVVSFLAGLDPVLSLPAQRADLRVLCRATVARDRVCDILRARRLEKHSIAPEAARVRHMVEEERRTAGPVYAGLAQVLAERREKKALLPLPRTTKPTAQVVNRALAKMFDIHSTGNATGRTRGKGRVGPSVAIREAFELMKLSGLASLTLLGVKSALQRHGRPRRKRTGLDE